ncbi:MAG: hypothetical protein CME34_19515 [Gordonia sp.]|uniref:hypothetical protein n=1 Tax=Gordonia sp. (in: high G+C Gram-positive bacteria) TaxID=84139 RepID=UPI000C551C0F|nr:hypothetical protein [Gordonia sp. (in: high G+C Gram-positive bacteria)]MAU84013.1 hypothetical protein [Gordonia sp. (in: high G+C Gram-positive bacteria)]
MDQQRLPTITDKGAVDAQRTADGSMRLHPNPAIDALERHEKAAAALLDRPLIDRSRFGYNAWWYGFFPAVSFELSLAVGRWDLDSNATLESVTRSP